MFRTFVLILFSLTWFAGCATTSSQDGDPFEQRELLRNSEDVLEGLFANKKDRFFRMLLPYAKGVVIFPDLVKAAFIAGARYGNGVAAVRNSDTGKWGPPAFIRSAQASGGLQAGIQKAEVVLLMMSNRSVKGLFKTKFDLGTGPEIALGPVGLSRGFNLRDIINKKDIYAYTSLKGLFAGFSWKGTVVRPDADANEVFNNRPVSHGTILLNRGIKPPKAATSFSKNLDKIAPAPKRPKS